MIALSTTENAPRTVQAAEEEGEHLRSLVELYDRFGARAYGLALSLTGDRETAERVVAASFVGAWQDLRPSAGSRDAFVCLMTVVRANALASRRVHRVSAEADGMQAAAGDRRSSEVMRALQQLPERQRRLLELAYYRGLGVAEIAAEVRESVSTVKTQLNLALRGVRSLLQPRTEQVTP
jgi:RNA polymerase sigma-70 factor, ECF subfamily